MSKQQETFAPTAPSSDIVHLLISNITIEPDHNSRHNCNTASLSELMASVRHRGILQPLIVRTKPDYDGKYYLVAGERRLHAAKRLGMEAVPCILYQKMTDVNAYYTQFIENAHREDLNPIEYAMGLANLMGQEINILDRKTNENKTIKINGKILAELCGLSTGKISQYLSILKLPVEIQKGIQEDKINFSQARSLCTIDDNDAQLTIYNKIVEGILTRTVDVQAEIDNIKGKDIEQATTKNTIQASAKDYTTTATNNVKHTRNTDLCDVDNANDPSGTISHSKMSMEDRLNYLRNTEVIVRSSDSIRKGLATQYKRYTRARTDEKKQYLEGYIAALEWSIGLCDN